jgi:PAS domain S-box-containing protein
LIEKQIPVKSSALDAKELWNCLCRDDPDRTPNRLSASQLRQIIDGASDTAIISTDETGLVTSWSLGAERILGWSAAEMFGQKLDRLFTEEDQKRGQLAREMQEALVHGRGGGEEGWRVRKDGTRMWAPGRLHCHVTF